MVFELKSMKGQKVLITGGAGFIGSNLAIKCLELGADVSVMTKESDKLSNLNEIKDKIAIIMGDITSFEDVENAIKNKEIIFHLAAQNSHIVSMEDPILDIESNLIGTMNILEACKKNNRSARIVSVGTVTQLGVAKKLPINEEMRDEPIEIYSADKLICEKYMQIYSRVYGMHTVFLRLGTLFGERQRLDNPKRGITNFFLGRIILDKEITIYGDGKFKRNYNPIENVVDALILSAQNEKAKGEVFIVGGENMEFIEKVKLLTEASENILGKKAKIKFIEFPQNEKKVDVGDTILDYMKIKNMIGWEPRITVKGGIERMVRFYKENYKEYMTNEKH